MKLIIILLITILLITTVIAVQEVTKYKTNKAKLQNYIPEKYFPEKEKLNIIDSESSPSNSHIIITFEIDGKTTKLITHNSKYKEKLEE